MDGKATEKCSVRSVLFITDMHQPEVLTMVEFIDGSCGIARNGIPLEDRRWPRVMWGSV